MNIENICLIFEELAGISREEAVAKSALVRVCATQIERRLKPGVSLRTPVLEYACGALAAYRYLISGGGEPSSVKAGDVTVTSDRDSLLKQAEALKTEYETVAAPYLIDPEFAFLQTPDV